MPWVLALGLLPTADGMRSFAARSMLMPEKLEPLQGRDSDVAVPVPRDEVVDARQYEVVNAEEVQLRLGADSAPKPPGTRGAALRYKGPSSQTKRNLRPLASENSRLHCDPGGLTLVPHCIATSSPLPPERKGRIPNRIYQTYPNRLLPFHLCERVRETLDMHPSFEYFLFGDLEREAWVKRNADSIQDVSLLMDFESYEDHVKSDVFRLMLLYVSGGIYLNMDAQTVDPLDTWIRPSDAFITGPDGRLATSSVAIVSRPKHPILKLAISETQSLMEQLRIMSERGVSVSRTIEGNRFLSRAFHMVQDHWECYDCDASEQVRYFTGFDFGGHFRQLAY